MPTPPTPRVTLVTGGCRSGKSRYALQQAAARPHPVFVATAEAFDSEMEALKPMVSDGLVRLDGERIRVTPAGKPFVRVAAAAFDRYFRSAAARHSQAI